MSKSILKVGLAIVGIVLAIPTGGVSLGVSLGLSTLAFAAVEIGIALASSLLLGPSMPKSSLVPSPTGRLYVSPIK